MKIGRKTDFVFNFEQIRRPEDIFKKLWTTEILQKKTCITSAVNTVNTLRGY